MKRTETIPAYQFMTEEIKKKLEKTSPYGEDRQNLDQEVIVKYFNPYGPETWLVTAGEQSGEDWMLYGYCYLSEWRWGCFWLSELEEIRPFDCLRLERDLYSEGTVRDLSRY